MKIDRKHTLVIAPALALMLPIVTTPIFDVELLDVGG
jgi:hypothetical protein